MATLKLVQLLILFNLATLLISTLACPTCPPTKSPPKVKPPPKKPPPTIPKTPVKPKPPPGTPCPPPAPPPKKPATPPAPPPKKPATPPLAPPPLAPPPKMQETCPIDALKLVACVDVLNSLVHIGIGNNVKDTCCPVLEGLVDLDAALCLCTAIKAELLNINILIPIALQVLVDCGKNAPEGFQCPA